MAISRDEFNSYAEHPRYGRRPYITGLNPETIFGGDVYLRWSASPAIRIANTAIEADTSRQQPRGVAVTHYYDERRHCRDCERPFIFFAAEQKCWYEELGFNVDSDCVRCFDCRSKQRGLARQRERYEHLFRVPERTTAEDLEMAECCMALIESGDFHIRQTERVRMLLNRLKDLNDPNIQTRRQELTTRIVAIENQTKPQRNE